MTTRDANANRAKVRAKAASGENLERRDKKKRAPENLSPEAGSAPKTTRGRRKKSGSSDRAAAAVSVISAEAAAAVAAAETQPVSAPEEALASSTSAVSSETAPAESAQEAPEASPSPRPKGMNPVAKGVRLLLVGMLMLGFLALAGWWGFLRNLSHSVGDSPTYNEAKEYSARFEEEAPQHNAPLDELMLVPGAIIQESEAFPTEDVVRQQATYIVRQRPSFVAEWLMENWRSKGLIVEQQRGFRGSISLQARAERGPRFHVMVQIKANDNPPDSSLINAMMARKPRLEELEWMAYPKELPHGPAGSRLDTKGGALGPSRLGRLYTWTVAMDANESMRYFKNAMLRKGWTVQPLGPQEAKKRGVLYSYKCSKGSESYTMNIGSVKGNDTGRPASAVVFVVF